MSQTKNKEEDAVLFFNHAELKLLNYEVSKMISEVENFCECKVADSKHEVLCDISNKIHRAIRIYRNKMAGKNENTKITN